MTKPKLTDKELRDALDEATSEAELERIAALTPEQVREELVAHGEDPAAVDAEADAFFATLDERIAAAAPAPAPAPARVVPLWRRPAVVVTAGLALAAGVLLYVQSQPDLVGSAPPEPTGTERASHMRQAAKDACEQHDWKSCLDDLEDARALDPEGDSAVDVQVLWKKAREGAESPTAP